MFALLIISFIFGIWYMLDNSETVNLSSLLPMILGGLILLGFLFFLLARWVEKSERAQREKWKKHEEEWNKEKELREALRSVQTEKEAERGNPTSCFQMGKEREKAKRREEALQWYLKAAEAGLAEAQRATARLYHNAGDNKSALKWYQKAAEQGDAQSQMSLASMYKEGQGTSVNYQAAMYWYKEAADNGNAQAYYCIGDMYRRGQGVHPDISYAMKWFEMSAERGFYGAQEIMAEAYERGIGVKANELKANYWKRKIRGL